MPGKEMDLRRRSLKRTLGRLSHDNPTNQYASLTVIKLLYVKLAYPKMQT